MSTLLQGDLDQDSAATAYLGYLTGLEEVAKLEPCGMYYLPATEKTDESAFVVARTAGAHRKYYFRRLESGAWTPWEQVQIDCEDLPLTPIVWNGRLFLFWLKTVKQTLTRYPPTPTGNLASQPLANVQLGDLNSYSNNSAQSSESKSVSVQGVLCWTEFYNGTWQPTKTSDPNLPTEIGVFDASGPGSFEANRGLLRLVPSQVDQNVTQGWRVSFNAPDGSLTLAVTNPQASYAYGGFLLHNTHSLPVRFEDVVLYSVEYDWYLGYVDVFPVPLTWLLAMPMPGVTFLPSAAPFNGGYGAGTFSINYLSATDKTPQYTNDILTFNWTPRQIQAQPFLDNPWDAPFFYEDRRNLFYVKTTDTLVLFSYYDGFGMQPATRTPAVDVPNLILQNPPPPGVPTERLAAKAAAGGKFTTQQYVAAGNALSAALNLSNAVTYHGQAISPVGGFQVHHPNNAKEA
jgi:hypothetical protein